LHTNSAPETLTRLLDMGLDPFNFADALLGALAQRLARTLCKACKEAEPASAAQVEAQRQAYGAAAFEAVGLGGADAVTGVGGGGVCGVRPEAIAREGGAARTAGGDAGDQAAHSAAGADYGGGGVCAAGGHDDAGARWGVEGAGRSHGYAPG